MDSKDRSDCFLLIGEAVNAGVRKFMAYATLNLEIRIIERREPNNPPSNALSAEE